MNNACITTPSRQVDLVGGAEGEPERDCHAAAPNAVQQVSSLKSAASKLARARKYLAKVPPAVSGDGGDAHTYYVSCLLVKKFRLTEEEAMKVFREWNATCVPPWSEEELLHKVRSALNAQYTEGCGRVLGEVGNKESRADVNSGVAVQVRRAVKPVFRPMVLKRVAAKAGFVGDVVEFVKNNSPVMPDHQSSSSVLRHLYPPGSGERVLIFSNMKSQGQMVWQADDSDGIQDTQLPAGPEGVWFLAQPVDGEVHPNPRQGGKMSRRSEESVTAWRYVVLESDDADPDDWLRCLIQMIKQEQVRDILAESGRPFNEVVIRRNNAVQRLAQDLRRR